MLIVWHICIIMLVLFFISKYYNAKAPCVLLYTFRMNYVQIPALKYIFLKALRILNLGVIMQCWHSEIFLQALLLRPNFVFIVNFIVSAEKHMLSVSRTRIV